jgi:ribonuclease P protein component
VATPATLQRHRRIRRRADFLRVQTLAKRVMTPHFVLLVARHEPSSPAGAPGECPCARLGLVASRRIGGAVARNRVKRLCRECFRLLPELLPAGVDLVVIARDGSDCMKLHEVRAEWEGVATTLRRRATEALAQSRPQPHVSATETSRTPKNRR